MRISNPKNHGRGRPQAGMAVIVVVTLLAIILLYVAYNARTLYHLGRELKLLEQKQIQRLAPPAKTNAVTMVSTDSSTIPSQNQRP